MFQEETLKYCLLRTQYENFRINLSLRFLVRKILERVEFVKLPFEKLQPSKSAKNQNSLPRYVLNEMPETLNRIANFDFT